MDVSFHIYEHMWEKEFISLIQVTPVLLHVDYKIGSIIVGRCKNTQYKKLMNQISFSF